MNRKNILKEAEKIICGQREQDYGSPEDSFERIAKYWSDYLSTIPRMRLTSFDVAVMMCLFKIARINHGQATEDTMIDLVGYAAIAGSLSPKIGNQNEMTQEDDDQYLTQEEIARRL